MNSHDNFLGYFNHDFITLLNRTNDYKAPNSVYPDWCTDCNHEEHIYGRNKIMKKFMSRESFEYKTNNYGFRSDDFSSKTCNNNFLFGGCSNTFASGLPFKFSWINHFNQEFNKKEINTTSAPSSSCDIIIHNTFTYIRKIGNPEGIILLFPNIERLVGREFHKFDNMDFEVRVLVNRGNTTSFVKVNDGKYYLERRFLQDIMFLEEICRLRGIKFMWSTWDKDFDILIKKYFNKYVTDFYSMIDNKIQPVDANDLAPKDFVSDNYWLESRDAHIPGLEQFIWAQSMIRGWKEKYESYNKGI